jgi:hypothetical protein
MSNVVSPRGPLPPRVYWRRRLVLCAVVVGLVLLGGTLFGGGEDTEPVADRGAAAPGATPTTGPTNGPTGRSTTGPAPRPAKGTAATRRTLTPRQVARRVAARAWTAELSGPTGPLAPATGPCAASDVAVVPDVKDTHAFSAVPLRIGLTSTGEQACTFQFSADSVALRVTSGEDLIWETLHCAGALPEESVEVRPGWLSYVTVDWSGRRGSEGCGDGGDYAEPGYYWAEAAAIGGEPARSQFELTTPPKPTPKPEPSTASSTKPGDEPSPTAESSTGTDGAQQPGTAPRGSDSDQPTPTQSTKPSAGSQESRSGRARGTGG